jgi:hypothetical protein
MEVPAWVERKINHLHRRWSTAFLGAGNSSRVGVTRDSGESRVEAW